MVLEAIKYLPYTTSHNRMLLKFGMLEYAKIFSGTKIIIYIDDDETETDLGLKTINSNVSFIYLQCFDRINSFDSPPARIFGCRVLELKEQGVSEETAMAVADVCISFYLVPGKKVFSKP